MKVRLVLLLLLLSSTIQNGVSMGSFHGISGISVSPESFSSREVITVDVTFTDSNNVSSVRVTYCRVLPEYLCYFPSYKAEKTAEDKNTFSVNIELKEEDLDGYTIGLRVLVLYKDSTGVDIPDMDTPDWGLTVIEPEDGLYYFGFKLGDENITTTTSAPLFISGTLLALSLRKRKAQFLSIRRRGIDRL